LGTNVLSLSGADAASLSLVDGAGGKELHFNGGANFEAKAGYDVVVNVNDASVGPNPDASQSFHLAINDVVESDSDTSNDYDLFRSEERRGGKEGRAISITDDEHGNSLTSVAGSDT